MSHEKTITVRSGWAMLTLNLVLALWWFALMVGSIVAAEETHGQALAIAGIIVGILGVASAIVLLCGHFTLQPNTARVLILFGSYQGTVRESGFHWTNPFNTKLRVSLRARNFEGQKLKVNDKRGNPIEIAAVVVWRVHDTAQATFDVDHYEEYVRVQSESAVRHLANSYAYDHGEEGEITLRSGVEEVSVALQQELHARLAKAGVEVDEARLTHLAYASEIAGVMLRRQQAEAIIAARQKIVHGAVSMVQMALHDLAEKQVVELDNDRKAAMVSNLLVVLCGDSEVTPVVNTGTFVSLMNPRKPFLLRLDPALYDAIEAWAQQELRSVNGQIEFILKQAVARRASPRDQQASQTVRPPPADG